MDHLFKAFSINVSGGASNEVIGEFMSGLLFEALGYIPYRNMKYYCITDDFFFKK